MIKRKLRKLLCFFGFHNKEKYCVRIIKGSKTLVKFNKKLKQKSIIIECERCCKLWYFSKKFKKIISSRDKLKYIFSDLG